MRFLRRGTRRARIAAPSNSPAQGSICGQLGALRISFAMGIDLWIRVDLLETVPKRGQETFIGNP